MQVIAFLEWVAFIAWAYWATLLCVYFNFTKRVPVTDWSLQ